MVFIRSWNLSLGKKGIQGETIFQADTIEQLFFHGGVICF